MNIASRDGQLHIIEILLDSGADIESKNMDGYTPLMMASTSNRLNIVEFLLDNGANIDSKSNDGYTSLICAASERRDCVNIIKTLLNRGADSKIKDNYGWSFIDYFRDNINYEDDTALNKLKELVEDIRNKKRNIKPAKR